jgi:hypothetical protein
MAEEVDLVPMHAWPDDLECFGLHLVHELIDCPGFRCEFAAVPHGHGPGDFETKMSVIDSSAESTYYPMRGYPTHNRRRSIGLEGEVPEIDHGEEHPYLGRATACIVSDRTSRFHLPLTSQLQV